MTLDKDMTVRKLMQLIGHEQHTVTYGESRSVLNNLDSPVLAYGVGYAGFVAIYRSKNKQLKGVGYSVRNITKYADASLSKLELQEVLDMIKENKLFRHVFVKDKIEQEFAEEKEREKYVAPFIGKFHYVSKADYKYYAEDEQWQRGDRREIDFHRFKKGTYDIRIIKGYGGSFRESEFLMLYNKNIQPHINTEKCMTMTLEEFNEQVKTLHKTHPECKLIILENTLPSNVLEEMNAREFAKALKK